MTKLDFINEAYVVGFSQTGICYDFDRSIIDICDFKDLINILRDMEFEINHETVIEEYNEDRDEFDQISLDKINDAAALINWINISENHDLLSLAFNQVNFEYQTLNDYMDTAVQTINKR